MKVSALLFGDRLIASSDFDEKLVVTLIPWAAAAAVTLRLLTRAPLVVN